MMVELSWYKLDFFARHHYQFCKLLLIFSGIKRVYFCFKHSFSTVRASQFSPFSNITSVDIKEKSIVFFMMILCFAQLNLYYYITQLWNWGCNIRDIINSELDMIEQLRVWKCRWRVVIENYSVGNYSCKASNCIKL